MLETVSPERLMEASENHELYDSIYSQIIQQFDEYMNDRTPHARVQASPAIKWSSPIAYFSTEYGLHESIPIYSGGLGTLSGDHLKTASDLNIPLVGIGLLYKNGYFKQVIDKNGIQIRRVPGKRLFHYACPDCPGRHGQMKFRYPLNCRDEPFTRISGKSMWDRFRYTC